MKEIKIAWIYLFAVLCMGIWGLSFVFSRMVLEVYSPVTAIFVRMVISSAILIPLALILRKNEKIRGKDLAWLLLSAFFEPFCYFLGENYGILGTSSTISAVIIATIPVLTPIAAYYFLREKYSVLNLIGVILSFGGILLMLSASDFSWSARLNGILLLFCAVISAIFSTLLLKKLSASYSSLTIIAYQNFFWRTLFFAFVSLDGRFQFFEYTL